MRTAAAILALSTLLAPPASAWGALGHRTIAAAALKDLPPGLAPWFEGSASTLVDHANDPNPWKRHDPLERPRHFLGCEAYGGAGLVPLDEAAARTQLGPDRFQKSGQLPWIILERVDRLTQAFQAKDRPQAVLEASILSHYVGDLLAPLHATLNYNGEMTDQRGIQEHWETALVDFIVADAGWLPEARPARPEEATREAPWAWLKESSLLANQVLADDALAHAGVPRRGDPREGPGYWRTFLLLQGPTVKERLALSAQRTAEMILLAWNTAGSPSLR